MSADDKQDWKATVHQSRNPKAQSVVDGLGVSFQLRRVVVPTPIYGAMILPISIMWSMIEQDASFGL